ncbi:MAG: TIGR00159 family protein [Chloroflexaceae bacterium]|nr:TIGR00159 family protein [Chloroflexaceae bacterium]NJL32762.1 TIGR00159 family protein [Chloroflexaceae bacterium]NJO04277.1 TIGR00159 family protein [Chloroflexaceae bacterium]
MENIQNLLNRLNPLVYPTTFIDILVVTAIFFWLLGVVQGTRAVQLVRGISILLVLSFFVGSIFDGLRTLEWLLRTAIQPALIVAIPILFQPELRRALETLGRSTNLLNRPFGTADSSELLETMNSVSRAAAQLSKQGIGALMVLERNTRLQEYASRGVLLDARVAVPLLLNIFYPNSPLHDMAVIIRGNRIVAANVVLPLSEDIVGQRRYGTRHRAAKGISEQTDAVTVVVSEETGAISLVVDGRMISYLSESRLRSMLIQLFRIKVEENPR